MSKIFIDTDITIDLLIERASFFQSASKLFELVDAKKIKAFTSPIVLSNIFYIVAKEKSKKYAINAIRKLKSILNILKIDGKVVELALSSDFNDFEDAMQYYAAMETNIDCIVTRNKKDFKHSMIPVLSAEEYIAQQGL